MESQPPNVIDMLHAKQSAIRRRAAISIRKKMSIEFGDALYACFLKEQKDPRTWETQMEMIKALGWINHKPAVHAIEALVRINAKDDAITTAAATAFIQLQRTSIRDGHLALELLKTGNFAVVSGAAFALAIDKMMPDDDTIRDLLRTGMDLHRHEGRIGKEYGLVDARKYLAIACANWDKNLTHDFLNHCIHTATSPDSFGKLTEDSNLIAVCKNSLVGKYSSAYISA